MPVVIEFILERVTNISMGTEIDNINEFEDIAKSRGDAPASFGPDGGAAQHEKKELATSRA